MEKIVAITFMLILTSNTFAEGILDAFVRRNITGEITDSLENPEMVQRQKRRIDTLARDYRERADYCEADLVLSKQHHNFNELQSLRLVADINDTLGANLNESGWSMFDGYRVDYTEYNCDQIKKREDLDNINHTVLSAGSRWSALLTMCNEQHRLKSCFSDIEVVLRDNDVQTSDLDRTDYVKMPSFDNDFIMQEFINPALSQ
jgi:hypothetical protein